MPDPPNPKARPHPWKTPPAQPLPAPAPERPDTALGAGGFAQLQVTTNFTFLTGASHPDEMVRQAAALGHRAIGITDVNTLGGVVRAHVAARETGIQLVVGCRLVFAQPDSPSLLVYPTSRIGYANLCQLLTLGKRRTAKGQCRLELHDLFERNQDLLAVALPPERLDERFIEALRGLQSLFNLDRLSIGAACLFENDHRTRLRQLSMLADHVRVPLVAVNDVHYHVPERRPLQDVLTCIRHGCSLDDAGYRLFPNAERHLKPGEEMARLFASAPGALERTIQIAQRAQAFNLDQLKYQYPDEVVPPGSTPMQHLARLTQAGSLERYPGGAPAKVQRLIDHEMSLIADLHYAPYFLTVHDIVVFARSRGILCQGRGAAANSAVCYCLGVTAVDPDRVDMLFERFISKERNEPPDIDIDFEHERREEVIQYLYAKYGRDRAALTAEVISYRPRSAVRDVGKTLGLSPDLLDRLARTIDWFDEGVLTGDRLAELGINAADPTIKHLIKLTAQIQGFPRHLSQHVGGFVITRGPLCEMVPIENAAMADRTVIEWDKDDIDAMGMLKVDILGLGMLTCIRKTMELIEAHHGRALTLATIPPEDPDVYDSICRADTVGVFQIESRAQMSMLPRLRPRCYYDLVIEVAIVRPGPIQGDMVHPYLRRRNGEEPYSYPTPEVERVLGRTLGVPLFQEQAMALAIVAAGFTAGEADQLRRAIASWKSKQKVIFAFGQKLIDGMIRFGYDPQFAHRCFEQIKGFSEYGFPESHAASFALLVYVSAWLKHHYPAAFACALLNSQPMGFYAPAQIVRDAQEHGVPIREVDVNHSDWTCALEPAGEGGHALRLGLGMVKSVREPEARKIVNAVRARGRFRDVESLRRTCGVRVATLRALAAADAFGSMKLDRQAATWQAFALSDAEAPLFEQSDARAADPAGLPAALPPIPGLLKVAQDYASVGLSLKAHPMSFLRASLTPWGVATAADLMNETRHPHGRPVRVAGVVLLRQRPGTAGGIVFMTLEDETGIINLIVRPKVFEHHRRVARHSVVLMARGRTERQGQVVHVMVHGFVDLDRQMTALHAPSRDFH